MAGQKSPKPKKEKKSGGMPALISKVCSAVAAVLMTVFFAAVFDIGHIDLIHTIAGLAIGLVPLFAICALAAIFLAPKPAEGGNTVDPVLFDQLLEFQSKATSQIIALQDHVDSMAGNDAATLKERNKELQAELDAIHQAERDKVDSQLESLRQRNEELEAQIKQWALEAVGKSVKGEPVQPMKAA